MTDKDKITMLVNALQLWLVYYEHHSTQANRDRAYSETRLALWSIQHDKKAPSLPHPR